MKTFIALLLLLGLCTAAHAVPKGTPMDSAFYTNTPVTVDVSGKAATPQYIPGSNVAKTKCIITNPDSTYNLYFTWAANTVTAAANLASAFSNTATVNTVVCIPPLSTIPVYGYWDTQTFFYASVSPTPLTVMGSTFQILVPRRCPANLMY